jgi:type VI secretion system protein ImpC
MSASHTPLAFLDRNAPAWSDKRPARILLMGDFSARAATGRLHVSDGLATRKPVRVEFDSLDALMRRWAITLPMSWKGDEENSSVALTINALDDFHPDELCRAEPLLSARSDLRKRLNDPASVDGALSNLLRQVLHHPGFQNLESLWRGVDWLLRQVQTGSSLEVHLLDVAAPELAADLGTPDDLSQTALYALLVDQPSSDAQGGFSAICALYDFEATPQQLALIGRATQIAAQAQAVLITGLVADAIQLLTHPKEAPPQPIAQAFADLQALSCAGNLGLFTPRFMLRHAYGKRGEPIGAFQFEEFTAQEGLSSLLWGHPALMAAALLAAPATRLGAAALSVGDLPFHYFVDANGEQTALPCTERLVKTDAAGRLSAYGVRALLAHKGQASLSLAGLTAINGAALSLRRVAAPQAAASTTQVHVGKPLQPKPEQLAECAARDPEKTVSSAALSASSPEMQTNHPAQESDPNSMDDLLAQLSAAEPPAPLTPEATTAEPPAMDPELAALLKALEG